MEHVIVFGAPYVRKSVVEEREAAFHAHIAALEEQAQIQEKHCSALSAKVVNMVATAQTRQATYANTLSILKATRKAFQDQAFEEIRDLADQRNRLMGERAELKQQVRDLVDGLRLEQQTYAATRKQYETTQSALNLALQHLDTVLNGCKTHEEQQRADGLARDLLNLVVVEPR